MPRRDAWLAALPGNLMPICVQPWQRYAAACRMRDGQLSERFAPFAPTGRSHQPSQHIGPLRAAAQNWARAAWAWCGSRGGPTAPTPAGGAQAAARPPAGGRGAANALTANATSLAALDRPHRPLLTPGLGADGPALALGPCWAAHRRVVPQAATARSPLRATSCPRWPAVSHAHGQLIAHRDLRPANVLVTPEGPGQVAGLRHRQLLVARDASATDGTALTRHGLLATPHMPLPGNGGRPVSVATDVYALGLMLFGLLTDTPPLLAKRPAASPPLQDQPAY